RDFVAELLFVACLSGAHLSRFSEDWIFFTSQEAGFLELGDEVSTGSSLMPHKKNPDALELVRGKGARLLGRLTGFVACLRSLPLAYDKDLQEDKEALFESLDTWDACLSIATLVIQSARFDRERCGTASRQGFLNATELAQYLVSRGVAFRDAHEQVGRLVRAGISKGRELHELSLDEIRSQAPDCGADVFEVLELESVLEQRQALGSANPSLVRDEARRWLEELDSKPE
ncbi:MAG: argininosuccinate lyase, partial [Planctomycetota bacterium]